MIGFGQTGVTHDFFAYNSSNQVWNGTASAFQNFSAGSYTSYRITATETGTGSGVFTGTRPSGTARYELRVQAGTLATSFVVWEESGLLELTGSANRLSVSSGGAVLVQNGTATGQISLNGGAVLFQSGTASGQLLASGGVVQSNVVQIDSNSTAATYLGYFLLGTGHLNGVRLSAEQWKVVIDSASEVAVHIENTNGGGTAEYIYGGIYGQNIYGGSYGQNINGGSYGQNIYGGNAGQNINGGNYGQYIYGGSYGQYIYGGSYGQNIYGGSYGQYIEGSSTGQYINGGNETAVRLVTTGTQNAYTINGVGVNAPWNTTTPPTTAQIAAAILTNTSNTLSVDSSGRVTSLLVNGTASGQITLTNGQVTASNAGSVSAQSVRDAMALALSGTVSAASGSVDAKLDAIQAKTDTISTGGDVTTVRRTSGYIEIVQSTSNLNSTGTEFTFNKASTDTGWPSNLASAGYSVSLWLYPIGGGTATEISGGTVIDADSVRVDVSAAQAAALTPADGTGANYKYQVWASTSTTNRYCLDDGRCRVIDDIRS